MVDGFELLNASAATSAAHRATSHAQKAAEHVDPYYHVRSIILQSFLELNFGQDTARSRYRFVSQRCVTCL